MRCGVGHVMPRWWVLFTWLVVVPSFSFGVFSHHLVEPGFTVSHFIYYLFESLFYRRLGETRCHGTWYLTWHITIHHVLILENLDISSRHDITQLTWPIKSHWHIWARLGALTVLIYLYMYILIELPLSIPPLSAGKHLPMALSWPYRFSTLKTCSGASSSTKCTNWTAT